MFFSLNKKSNVVIRGNSFILCKFYCFGDKFEKVSIKRIFMKYFLKTNFRKFEIPFKN